MTDPYIAVARAIYDTLVAAPAVVERLPTYRNTAAIFMGAPPPDAPLPRIVVQGPVNVVPDDHLEGTRRDEIAYDIAILDSAERGVKALLDIATAVRGVLHAHTVPLLCGTVRRQTVLGPMTFMDDRPHAGLLLELIVLVTW